MTKIVSMPPGADVTLASMVKLFAYLMQARVTLDIETDGIDKHHMTCDWRPSAIKSTPPTTAPALTRAEAVPVDAIQTGIDCIRACADMERLRAVVYESQNDHMVAAGCTHAANSLDLQRAALEQFLSAQGDGGKANG